MEEKIILIRHGQSIGNLKRIYLGHTNLGLSELGAEQAERAARYFKDEKISAIYSSDLDRAYFTAIPHAKIHKLPIIKTEELREIYMGLWEGVAIDEIRKTQQYEFDIVWRQKFGESTPPGGEKVTDAARRIYNKLISIAKAHDGKILVTTHAALIRSLWGLLSGLAPSEWGEAYFFPTNASASYLGFDGEKLIPLKYSFDDYLNAKEEHTEA